MEETVKQNEKKFKFVSTTTWGDIDDAMHIMETKTEQIFNINSLKSNKIETITLNKSIDDKHENYDFQNDLEHFRDINKFAL